MKLNTRRFPLWCLLLAACAIPASAQWTSSGSCSSCQVPSNPIVTSMPMSAPTYQPTTQFAPVSTTVQTPVPYTRFVNQPMTQMVPVTRQQTRQVPSMQYRTVTQYQTRNRDVGRWRTNYYPTRRISACQYDSRPGFLGWMNRTGHGFRNLFTPAYTTRRQYVPNVVAERVPVRRQVAVPTTRTVAYNVTQMVPQTVNRQVAVNSVRYVAQNYTSMQPVQQFAYAPMSSIAPSVAYAPMNMAPSVAWAPSTTSIATGTTGYDPFGGSLVAAPIADNVQYDDMAVMTEDEFKRIADRDATMEPIPETTIPRRASRDPKTRTDYGRARDEVDFRDNRDLRNDRDLRKNRDNRESEDADMFGEEPTDRYEPGSAGRTRTSELEKNTRKTTFRQPSRNQPASREFDFADDAIFGNDINAAPASSRTPGRQPATRQPMNNGGARYPSANEDAFIPSSEPTFDDNDAFDDMDFGPTTNRTRSSRPVTMKRSASNQSGGWRAAKTPRKQSPKDNPILVSNRNR